MKALNETELGQFIAWLQPQVAGAQLQDIWTDGSSLFLDCYRRGVLQFQVDLRPNHCFLVLSTGEDVRRRKGLSRPVTLFLNANAKNMELVEIRHVADRGRMVELVFAGRDASCRLDLILIPQAPNVVVHAAGKKISWNKPRPFESRTEVREFPVRWSNWKDYLSEYKNWRQGGEKAGSVTGAQPFSSDPEDPRLRQWRRDLTKKSQVLTQLESASLLDEAQAWQDFGERLKLASAQDVQGSEYWDKRLGLAENRERAFRKAKDLRAKQEGTQERIQILKKEIAEIESWLHNPQGAPLKPQFNKRGSRILEKTSSKGRTLNLPSGLQAVLGRSARDNLAILRQARAWDYWIHLKDEPSAHAILFRDKNQNVSSHDIEAVADWLNQSGSGKKDALEGNKYEVIVVECRFVRPIKGDRLGRVTYHSPQVYRFVSKRKS